ncbi:DUF2079 domain-containing protein [Cellulomonas composti]|uniref:DUF2079 domain-containing protein n=1 Tax=Cellulomonas composti TaxID=266130 RepID=A0A511J9K2_9CELL|nr:DUF2079 domain-containing protein [Cellulomonas composti]GEL94662.1 hypothetical protein CCO02nite_13200 [Cellulomonas composti]
MTVQQGRTAADDEAGATVPATGPTSESEPGADPEQGPEADLAPDLEPDLEPDLGSTAEPGVAIEAEPDPVLHPAEGRWPWLGPLVVSVVAAVAYTVFSLVQWSRYEVPSWDLGIFTQLARRYASLESPIVHIKGDGFNLLGDHFHPLLVVLGPVYKVFPSAVTLLVVQNLLFALSAYVVGRHAVRVVGWLEGTALTLAYAASFGIAGAVAAQFHEIAFAVPLLALSLVALVRERWWACALWAAPLVFVKEDLGLTVILIGVVLWWRSRDLRALWLSVWGAGWTVLSTAVLIPLLNSGDQWDYGSRIDVVGILTHPWTAFTLLFDDGRKISTVLMLVAITGFVGLRSPVLLVAVPTLVWRFWADNDAYYGHLWHYSAVLMPIAFVALLDGVVLSRRSPRAWLRRYAVAAVPVAVVIAALFTPQLALARLVEPEYYAGSGRETAAQAILAQIPDDAVVETDIGLMSYLVDRDDVFYVGNAGNPTPDYLLIDDWGGGWNTAIGDLVQFAQDRFPGTTWELVDTQGSFRLVHRVD